eukprot:scaffold10392_cov57-Phaeocystis_antarctica.AAC.1
MYWSQTESSKCSLDRVSTRPGPPLYSHAHSLTFQISIILLSVSDAAIGRRVGLHGRRRRLQLSMQLGLQLGRGDLRGCEVGRWRWAARGLEGAGQQLGRWRDRRGCRTGGERHDTPPAQPRRCRRCCRHRRRAGVKRSLRRLHRGAQCRLAHRHRHRRHGRGSKRRRTVRRWRAREGGAPAQGGVGRQISGLWQSGREAEVGRQSRQRRLRPHGRPVRERRLARGQCREVAQARGAAVVRGRWHDREARQCALHSRSRPQAQGLLACQRSGRLQQGEHAARRGALVAEVEGEDDVLGGGVAHHVGPDHAGGAA